MSDVEKLAPLGTWVPQPTCGAGHDLTLPGSRYKDGRCKECVLMFTRKGRRKCLTCKREQDRRSRARKSARAEAV